MSEKLLSEYTPPSYDQVVGANGLVKVLSGTPWEPLAGYSRAVKKGNHIFVSGTTATDGNKAIGIGDPAEQMRFVLAKIQGSIQSLGGTLEDVVRTRIYIKHMEHWEVIARIHGELFETIQPANTMVQANLVGDEYLVEMEAEAIILD